MRTTTLVAIVAAFAFAGLAGAAALLLSDFDLAAPALLPRGDGRPIQVAWMNGRSRSYAIAGPDSKTKSALSVAFNDRCDAIVATVVLGHDRPAAIEPAVIEFLNGKTVLRWAEVALGL